MDYMNEPIPVDNANAWVAVIWNLQSSRPADARNAFEHLLSECERQRGSSVFAPQAISRFLNLNLRDGNMFGRYVDLLRRLPMRMNYELSCDDQSATLDYAEGEAFQVIVRAAQNHPELAAELLDTVPSLKRKTEQVGGLEAIWERGQLRGKRPYLNSPVFYRGYKEMDARLDTLCSQFRVSPEEVRQTLAGLQSAKDFEFLCRAATGKCQAVADIASNLAREMTLNEPDPEMRMSMALKLLPYYFDNTRLDPKWIDYGFEILGRSGSRTASLDRSQFEDCLVSQLALVNFSQAMAYINSVKEPLSRLQLLLAVMQALDGELMRTRH